MPRINLQIPGGGILLSLFPDLEKQEPDDQGYGLQPTAKTPIVVNVDRDKEIKEYCKRLSVYAERLDLKSILGSPRCIHMHRHIYTFTDAGVLHSNTDSWRYIDNNPNVPKIDWNTYQNWSNPEGITANILHLCENGDIWCIPVNFHARTDVKQQYGEPDIVRVNKINILKPKKNTKRVSNAVVPQDEYKIHEILTQKKPYVETWLKEHPSYLIGEYLNTPWMETLDKAGYKIAEYVLQGRIDRETADVERLNRLCKNGTNPKEIFKTSKAVYSVLKNSQNLSLWDMYRKLDKTGKIKQDTIRIAYDANWSVKDLSYVNAILAKHYEGKPVFTWTSLTNYLGRLDMFEAISHGEALPILSDYLSMCSQLNIRPRTDGDSLKREHDVAARLVRQKRDEIIARKMEAHKAEDQKLIEAGNTKLAKLEYHEKVYFVRPITEYNDLIDEATQQDNCVASYADRIARGQTRILTMRESAHPEKSLITIELSPDCREIRQKFLAHNQQIRNKSMSDFINRWIKQLNS